MELPSNEWTVSSQVHFISHGSREEYMRILMCVIQEYIICVVI